MLPALNLMLAPALTFEFFLIFFNHKKMRSGFYDVRFFNRMSTCSITALPSFEVRLTETVQGLNQRTWSSSQGRRRRLNDLGYQSSRQRGDTAASDRGKGIW